MTILVPMRADVFPSYLESAIVDYAEENILSGRWPKEFALARSTAEFERLLPQGLASPNNYLYEITESETCVTLGYLWFFMQEIFGHRSAFVYDLKIKEEYRRQGYAKRAFVSLESLALGLNISSIALHVFAHNVSAQALYERLGYMVTGINMRKNIS